MGSGASTENTPRDVGAKYGAGQQSAVASSFESNPFDSSFDNENNVGAKGTAGMSERKLKKMALGLPGYKDVQRDYAETLEDLGKFNNIKSETPETPNSGVVYNRRYWANRFYLFLSKMTEMKSRPKDEKGLYLFELHIPPVDEPLPEPSESDLELKAAREETAKDPWVNSDCLAK